MKIEDIVSFPFTDYPLTTQLTLVGGRYYNFDFGYNAVHDFTSISIADEDGNQIISGVKIVYGLNLFAGIGGGILPKGTLIFTTKNIRDRIGELNDTVYAYYTEESFDTIDQLVEALED